MLAHIPLRETRRFHVYKDRTHVLIVADQPGRLHSTAGPAPSGPPEHPFLDGIALDALSEHELGSLLRDSTSFDDYLARLVAAGYDIRSDDLPARADPGPSTRLADGSGLLGVIWQRAGQSTTLARQPAPGALIFEAAALTFYREAPAEQLLAALADARSFDALLQALQASGIHKI